MPKYKIEFSFYSPLIYFYPPVFDSIILYQVSKRDRKTICCVHKPNGFFGEYKDYTGEYFEKIEDIPLTSRFIPEHCEDYFDSWKKRFDTKNRAPIQWGKTKKRINVASDKYRSYDMKIPGKVVKKGHFLISTPMIEEIEKYIMNDLFAIGKKRSMGHGIIDSIDIKEVDISVEDILKKRPIPIPVAEKFNITGERIYSAYKPPYWLKSNIVECVYHG